MAATHAEGVRSAVRRGGREGLATLGLLAGPVGWQLVFFVAPVGLVVAYSVGVLAFASDEARFTLESWAYLFRGPLYLGLFWKSVRISLIVSVAAVALAYPLAYLLALGGLPRRYAWMLFIVAPAWTNYVLRVFAWKVILGEGGIVNSFVLWTGLTDEPVRWLMYSEFAVIVVLTNVWVPFVALPIFVAIEGMDRALLEAAGDLGAGRWSTFWRVSLPISLPGVFAAFLFVFIPTIGEFVTPLFVGGTGGFMFANAITDLFGPGLDWRTGSVLATFLLVVVTALIVVLARALRLEGMGLAR